MNTITTSALRTLFVTGLIAAPIALTGCKSGAATSTTAAYADAFDESSFVAGQVPFSFMENMTGVFTSAAQAQANETYFDIQVAMVPIWTDSTDASWIYLEQTASETPNQPYRQRVYRLSSPFPGTVESSVFELPAPQDFIGAWTNPDVFATLSPADLIVRDGCVVLLEVRPDGTWVGQTNDTDCASDFRGASYATSEILLDEGLLTTWDRGFNNFGEQVWGAIDGPYIFDRVETFPEFLSQLNDNSNSFANVDDDFSDEFVSESESTEADIDSNAVSAFDVFETFESEADATASVETDGE